jgi:hypothetical protein
VAGLRGTKAKIPRRCHEEQAAQFSTTSPTLDLSIPSYAGLNILHCGVQLLRIPTSLTTHHGFLEPVHQWTLNHEELPGCNQLSPSIWCRRQLWHLWTVGIIHSSRPVSQRVSA